jgi:hypothetical protein
MDNILTKEEENQLVTYGVLSKLFVYLIDDISKQSINYANTLQEQTFELVRKLTDSLVEIRDNADYKRQRDIRFMINLFAQLNKCDKDVIYREYQRWCAEFDKINKPQGKPEGENG